MRKILFVVPSLGENGSSKQVLLLAAGLPRPQFDARVAVLGESEGHAPLLRARGIEIHELGWKRYFDLGVLHRLRQLRAAFAPDIVHAWSRASLRTLAAAGTLGPGRLVVSAAARQEKVKVPWCRPDFWLFRGADFIIAAGLTEAEQYRKQGIPEKKVRVVRPAVAIPSAPGTRKELCHSLGIPHDARLILCSDPLVLGNRVQDAVWTLEIIKYLFEDLHLLLMGSGPDRFRLERFVRAVGAQGHVHFLGSHAEASAFLPHVELVWVPNQGQIECNMALEAMAAGRPVVASRLPALAEIVQDGETGFLIDPGDKVGLARRTRWLLENQNCCRQMGEAGRQRSRQDFSVSRLVDRFACLYEEAMAHHDNGISTCHPSHS